MQAASAPAGNGERKSAKRKVRELEQRILDMAGIKSGRTPKTKNSEAAKAGDERMFAA